MGVNEEIGALHRMVKFRADEEILFLVHGDVSGGKLESREGILFVTHYRVGISAAGSWFTVDACCYYEYSRILGVKLEEPFVFMVSTTLGDFFVTSTKYSSHPFIEMARFIETRRNQVSLKRDHGLIEEGWNCLDGGEPKIAKKKAQRVLDNHKNSVDALLILATAEDRLGYQKKSIDKYHDALIAGAANPTVIHRELARLYLNQGEVRRAVEEANNSLSYGPDALTLIYRGQAKWASGEKAGAGKDFRQAVILERENPLFWKILSDFYLEINNVPGIRECIEQLRLVGENTYAMALEVSVLVRQKEWREAMNLGTQLLSECKEQTHFAVDFLHACSEEDPMTGIKELGILDQYHRDNYSYQFVASCLLLNGGGEEEALKRAQKIRDGLGEDFDWSQAEEFHMLLQVVEASAKYLINGSLLSERKIDDLRSMSAWKEDADVRDTCLGTLSFLEGLQRKEAGALKEALCCFRDAQSAERLMADSIEKGLEQTVRHTQGLLAAKEFSAEEANAEQWDIPTYELIKKASEHLRISRNLPKIERQAHSLIEQFDAPPLVAVMGEYSVGKSTFINALLGADLLPTGEGVTTGTIIWLKYGEEERIRVVYRDGHVVEKEEKKEISMLVTESDDGQTVRDIQHVELFLNASVLRRINIIDTPGLNAPFPEHEETTEKFLAESDAILFLFNIEAAGKASEGEFLSKVGAHRRKAVAIVNQIDLVPKFEVEEVLEFIRDDFGNLFVEVLGVSGKLALDASLSGDDAKRQRSQLPQLSAYLETNLLTQARSIKEEASRAKLTELLRDAEAKCEAFQDKAKQTMETIEDYSKKGAAWIFDDFELLLNQQEDSLQRQFEEVIENLAAELARRPQVEGLEFVPSTVLNSFLPSLSQDLRQIWVEFAETLADEYDDCFLEFREELHELTVNEENPHLGYGLRELEVLMDSWRSDLRSDIGSVRSYSDGFFDGGGFQRTYHKVPEDKLDNPKSISRLLTRELNYVVKQPIKEARDWGTNLIRQFDDRLYRIRRDMREEVNRVVSETYWPLLRLIPLCEPSVAAHDSTDLRQPRARRLEV